jgi:hypothetical protein
LSAFSHRIHTINHDTAAGTQVVHGQLVGDPVTAAANVISQNPGVADGLFDRVDTQIGRLQSSRELLGDGGLACAWQATEYN